MRLTKNKKIVTSICVSMALMVGGISIGSVLAQSSKGESKYDLVKKELSDKVQNKYGEIKERKVVDMDEKKLLEAEDDKYIYKARIDNGKIATIVAKSYEKLVKAQKHVSKDKIQSIADEYLSQFSSKTQNSKYKLGKYNFKNTDNEKVHEFIYYVVASNGVKTGESVAIEVTNDGELVLLATHDGNEKIALEATPKISQKDAEKISIDYIKTKLNEDLYATDTKLSINSELSVWEDKLVWIVKIDDIKLGDTRYGFDLIVDAHTSEILFNDYYCVLE